MTTEKDIVYKVGGFWVCKDRGSYVVYRPSPSFTHSISDSGFPLDADGLSVARARVDYLASRAVSA
jgi:hypothetical protein